MIQTPERQTVIDALENALKEISDPTTDTVLLVREIERLLVELKKESR